MKRFVISLFFAGLLALSWIPGSRSNAATEKISGQGKMRFRLLYDSTHLPARGSEDVDRRTRRLRRRSCGLEKARPYFGLRKARGLIQDQQRILRAPACSIRQLR